MQNRFSSEHITSVIFDDMRRPPFTTKLKALFNGKLAPAFEPIPLNAAIKKLRNAGMSYKDATNLTHTMLAFSENSLPFILQQNSRYAPPIYIKSNPRYYLGVQSITNHKGYALPLNLLHNAYTIMSAYSAFSMTLSYVMQDRPQTFYKKAPALKL